MRFTQCFKILLEIPSYPEAFIFLRYVTVFITSTSVTRIGHSTISLILVFSNSCKALCKWMYWLLKFSIICTKNLLKTLAIYVASVIRPASEFILVSASYNWDLAVESFIIFYVLFHFVRRSFKLIIKMCRCCFCNYFV